MIRVLYLINHAGKAGTEKYVQSLACGLSGGRVEAFFAYNEEGPLVQWMKELGVPVHKLEMRSRFDIGAALRLSRLCRKLGIDIIHTQFMREHYVALLSKLFNGRVKLVNTCHIIHVSRKADRLLNRFFSAVKCRFIAVSKAAELFLIGQGVRKDRIKVILNGIDGTYWTRKTDSNIRKEFGIDKESLVAVSVARFGIEKGHAFLLESIRKMFDLWEGKKDADGKKIVFLLVGDGDRLDECKTLAGKLDISDNIVFAGYRSDIRDILSAADIYVCHSRFEALGLSILEAMGCGLPVITTDAGGTSEIVNEETQCGILLKYGDTGAMAQAMSLMLQDSPLRDRYGRNGVKAVSERFNISMMSNETYNIYMKALNNN